MTQGHDRVTKSVTSRRKTPLKGGSRKGIPNKITAEVKDMVRQALNEAGGVAYLVKRANDPKTAVAFLSLVGKIVPLTLTGDGTAPLQIVISATDARL